MVGEHEECGDGSRKATIYYTRLLLKHTEKYVKARGMETRRGNLFSAGAGGGQTKAGSFKTPNQMVNE